MTRAIDTNVLIRWLVGDDPEQSIQANEIVAEGAFVALTVALEVEWVLRNVFDLPRPAVADALERMLTVDTLLIDQGDALFWALERFRAGADWADCIHLISARSATNFVTFDRKLAPKVGPDTPIAIETIRN